MSNLTEQELADINAAMDEVSYVTCGEYMRAQPPKISPEQKKESQKKAHIKRFYCEKNFLNKLWEVINRHTNTTTQVSSNSIKYPQPCGFMEQFFLTNQNEIDKSIAQIVGAQFDINYVYNQLAVKWLANWNDYIKQGRCLLQCRPGLISNSGVERYIGKYEDNFFVYSYNRNRWICHDGRSLLATIVRMDFFQDSIQTEYDISTIFLDILKELKDRVMSLPPALYPDAIKLAKRNMYKLLNEHYIDNIEVNDIKKIDLSENIEGKRIEQSCYITNHAKRDNSPKPEYAVLIQALFTLTEGSKRRFDEFAKVIAIVVSGTGLCKLFGLHCPQTTVITTNNALFVEDFFKSIFSGGFYMVVNPLGTIECPMTNCFNDKIIEQDVDSRNWGMTQHKVSSLSDPNKTGRYLEDKFHSFYINITTISKENKTVSDERYFTNLITGKPVKGKNQYLGYQTLKSEAHYIFITNNNKDTEMFSNIEYNALEFSQNMSDKVLFIPRWNGKSLKGRALSTIEKDFLLNEVAQYGMQIILDEKHKTQIRNTNAKDIADPIACFMQYCCDLVEFKDNDKPNENNATALMTFNIAYKLFYEIVDKTHLDGHDLNRNSFKRYNKISIIESRGRGISERDKKRGYDGEGETLEDKGVHLIGIVIKSKREIIEQAQQCKQRLEENLEILGKAEFVDFVMGLLSDKHIEDMRQRQCFEQRSRIARRAKFY